MIEFDTATLTYLFLSNVFTGFTTGLGSGLCTYFIFKKLLGDKEKKEK